MPELTLEQIAAIAAEANSETERALCRYAESMLKVIKIARDKQEVRIDNFRNFRQTGWPPWSAGWYDDRPKYAVDSKFYEGHCPHAMVDALYAKLTEAADERR